MRRMGGDRQRGDAEHPDQPALRSRSPRNSSSQQPRITIGVKLSGSTWPTYQPIPVKSNSHAPIMLSPND